MAGDFLKRKAEEQAKIIDEKYGEGKYGGTVYLKSKIEEAQKASVTGESSSTKSGGAKTDKSKGKTGDWLKNKVDESSVASAKQPYESTTAATGSAYVHDYSSAVKFLKDNGVDDGYGIMTHSEWDRRRASSGHKTYQSYLDDVVSSALKSGSYAFSSVKKNDDFEEYSAKGAAIENPTFAEAQGFATIFGWRPGAKEIENVVTFSRDTENAQMLRIGKANGSNLVGDERYENMTDDEVDIYNYLLAKEGKEFAQKYLDELDEQLTIREGKRIADNIKSQESTVQRGLLYGVESIVAGADSFATGVKSLPGVLGFSDEAAPTTTTAVTNQILLNDLDGFAKEVYQAGNAVGNMLPSIVVSMFTGGIGGSVAMGFSAAGNAYKQALSEGYSQGQARAYGIAVGASEGVLQYILGGISKLGGGKLFAKGLAKVKMIDNSLARMVLTGAIKIGEEITEEELQLFLEPAYRKIIFGEDYTAPEIDEIIETAIVTALSTGALESGTIISAGSKKNRKVGAEVKGLGEESVQAIIEEGLSTRANAESHVMAEQLQKKIARGEKVSNHEIGTLYRENIKKNNPDKDAGTLEQAAWDVVAQRDKVDGLTLLENRRRGIVNSTTLDVLTENGVEITTDEVRKVTGFGEEGAKLVTKLANQEGTTFSRAVEEVKPSYVTGFKQPDLDIKKAENAFASKAQADAFTAGKMDRKMQDLAAKERFKNAQVDSYSGSTVEAETAISPEEAQPVTSMNEQNMHVSDDTYGHDIRNKTATNQAGMSAQESFDYFNNLHEDDNRGRTTTVNGITIKIDRRFGSGYFVNASFFNGDTVTPWTPPQEFDTFEEAREYAAMLSFDAADYDGGLAPIDRFYGRNVIGVRLADAESGIKSDRYVTEPPKSVTKPTESAIKKADSVTETVENEKNTSRPTTEPEAERYDIPEGSKIVNNIVVDEHSKRLKRENPRAYSNIMRMAKRLGMNVRFVNNLVDENGKMLEGLITSKGIFINADAKNPSRFVATHEFGHRMKQAAPEVWAAYQEYVINKLKRENFGNGRTAYDVLYEETKNAYEKDEPDSINEEIAVNYVGELFDSEEMLESFIREDKGLALRVRDWWYNVLESLGLLSEKKKAQQLWLRAYTAAGKNVKEGTVGEYSGAKFKYVGETKNGIKKYVTDFPKGMSMETKQELFKQRIATIFNLGAVKLKTDVKKIQVLGDKFTSQKNIYGDEIASDIEMQAKINSLYDMAEILSNAKYVMKDIEDSYLNPEAKNVKKSHKGVKYWYKFKNTIYMDEVLFDVVFNVRDKGGNQYQYLVEFHKKEDNSNQPYGHKDLRRTLDELSPTDNIPQNVPIVNSNSMQNFKKNTKKEQLDIINQNNPAPNSYLTWVRTEDDIKTLSEALDDSDYRDYDKFTPDYTRKMAEQALVTGKITVYSSYPIIQGTFVTPSKMEAESYSGTGKVYKKTVKIKDVAWIDPTQGQYARVEEGKKSIPGTRLSELVEKYGAIQSGENPHRDVQVPRKTGENKKVSQTVRTILEAKATPDEALPTIEKMVEDGIFSYEAYSDKKAISDAEERLKGYGWTQSFTDWMRDVDKGVVSKQHTVMGWALYNNAVNRATTATSKTERREAMETALSVLNGMVGHQRSAAQALQATRILKSLSPETQLYGVQKSIQAFQRELIGKYGDKAPNLTINEELAEQFLKAENAEERAAIEAELYKDIGRQIPSRFIDKWNAWRYLVMLSALRTHARNILGNAFFAPVVLAKDLTATAIEAAVNRVAHKKVVRGKAIIIGTKADRELLKAAWKDFNTVFDMISNGGKYNDSAMKNQYIEQGRKIFKTAPLEWARRKNSALLEEEDMWFSKPHYAYALAQYCKANNISAEQIERGKALAPAREYAIKEAQKATYRDTNAFSQMVSGWGRSHKNEKNVLKKAFNTVVEGNLPFRKTPANILVRGVEYSPLGLLKGLSYDLHQVSKGKMTATEAIDNISAGLTGTGLLALGVLLAAQGLVRGHGEPEKEEKEFKELMGHQSYALELPNGKSVTLDWLAPEALPFFVGVNLWEATNGFDEKADLSTILQSVSRISEPMLEMSCLQGLNDLFEGIGYASYNDTSGLVAVVSSAITSYLTQGIPTLFGQAERTGEQHRMTTYTEKNAFLTANMQYTLGKASAKIPLWDYHQIPYIDAWGRKEASGTALKRGLNNFLNPAYTSTVASSKMEKELLRLYEKTGESSVFPQRADKYFMVDEKRKDLTAEEYVRYATLKGEKSYNAVTSLINSSAYKKLTDAEKVKAIADAYDYANQKAKKAVSAGYKTEKWTSTADAFGTNVGSFLSFRAEVSNTKKENGDKISKQEVADIVLDMAQNGSDAWEMYLSTYEESDGVKYARDNGVNGKTYMNFLEALGKVDEPTKSGKYGTYTQDEARDAVELLEGLSCEEKAALWQSVNTTWKKNPYR